MKLSLILLIATVAVACGQPDKTFKEQITVEKGIRFGDGTIQLTALIGGTTYWNDVLSKPLTFPPIAHTHDYATDLTNKPGTIELQTAISQLGVLVVPKKTTAEIALLAPTAGSLVYDVSLNVLKIGNGSVYKILITAN